MFTSSLIDKLRLMLPVLLIGGYLAYLLFSYPARGIAMRNEFAIAVTDAMAPDQVELTKPPRLEIDRLTESTPNARLTLSIRSKTNVTRYSSIIMRLPDHARDLRLSVKDADRTVNTLPAEAAGAIVRRFHEVLRDEGSIFVRIPVNVNAEGARVELLATLDGDKMTDTGLEFGRYSFAIQFGHLDFEHSRTAYISVAGIRGEPQGVMPALELRLKISDRRLRASIPNPDSVRTDSIFAVWTAPPPESRTALGPEIDVQGTLENESITSLINLAKTLYLLFAGAMVGAMADRVILVRRRLVPSKEGET